MKQFSLEGVAIEPGQTKELPDEQAQRFLDIYAHTGKLVKVDEIAQATIQPMAAAPEPTVIEKVEEEILKVEDEIEAEVQPALKVFKRGRKPKTQ